MCIWKYNALYIVQNYLCGSTLKLIYGCIRKLLLDTINENICCLLVLKDSPVEGTAVWGVKFCPSYYLGLDIMRWDRQFPSSSPRLPRNLIKILRVAWYQF